MSPGNSLKNKVPYFDDSFLHFYSQLPEEAQKQFGVLRDFFGSYDIAWGLNVHVAVRRSKPLLGFGIRK